MLKNKKLTSYICDACGFETYYKEGDPLPLHCRNCGHVLKGVGN